MISLLLQGYLLDCYPSKTGGMTFWVQKNDGEAVKFEDREWRARIYAAAGANDLDYLSSAGESSNLVSLTRRKYKRIDPFSRRKAEVLELELKQAGSGKKLATFLSKIFRHPDMLQLYNVDFLPEQAVFLRKRSLSAGTDRRGCRPGWIDQGMVPPGQRYELQLRDAKTQDRQAGDKSLRPSPEDGFTAQGDFAHLSRQFAGTENRI